MKTNQQLLDDYYQWLIDSHIEEMIDKADSYLEGECGCYHGEIPGMTFHFDFVVDLDVESERGDYWTPGSSTSEYYIDGTLTIMSPVDGEEIEQITFKREGV